MVLVEGSVWETDTHAMNARSGHEQADIPASGRAEVEGGGRPRPSGMLRLHHAGDSWTFADLVLQMERMYQMNVVPDMLPELHPSFDLRIRYLEPPPKSNYLRTRVKRKLKQVEPGIFLVPEQVSLLSACWTTARIRCAVLPCSYAVLTYFVTIDEETA